MNPRAVDNKHIYCSDVPFKIQIFLSGTILVLFIIHTYIHTYIHTNIRTCKNVSLCCRKYMVGSEVHASLQGIRPTCDPRNKSVT